MIGNGKKSTFFDGYFKLMGEYELNRPFVSKKVLVICFILMLLPVFIDAYSGRKMTETEKSNLNKLTACMKQKAHKIKHALHKNVNFSFMDDDFYSLPEVVLFMNDDIQVSLTDLYAIRHSFKAHLKKYEKQQDVFTQINLQPAIAGDADFLGIFVPLCEECDVWSKIGKKDQKEFIDGTKVSLLESSKKIRVLMNEHNISSGVDFKIAYLKESLKLLDVWQDLLLENTNEPSIKLKQDFDLHAKKINEIVKKESEFLSDVGKKFELKKSDQTLGNQEN